jgi:hypothetical protein
MKREHRVKRIRLAAAALRGAAAGAVSAVVTWLLDRLPD